MHLSLYLSLILSSIHPSIHQFIHPSIHTYTHTHTHTYVIPLVIYLSAILMHQVPIPGDLPGAIKGFPSPRNIHASSISSYLSFTSQSSIHQFILLPFTTHPSFTLSLNIYYLLVTFINVYASCSYITANNSCYHFIVCLHPSIQPSAHVIHLPYHLLRSLY